MRLIILFLWLSNELMLVFTVLGIGSDTLQTIIITYWAPTRYGYIIWFTTHISGLEKSNNLPKVTQPVRSKCKIWTWFYLTPGALPSAAFKQKMTAEVRELRDYRNCRLHCLSQGGCKLALLNHVVLVSEVLSWINPSTHWGFVIWAKLFRGPQFIHL